MKFLFELIMLLIIFGTAEKHASLFKANIKISPWFHALWAGAYFIPAIVIGWFVCESWWLLSAFCLERFFFYNFLLNLIRHKPVFYLSTGSGKSASLWDKIELRWGAIYPIIWVLSGMLFGAIQFFI